MFFVGYPFPDITRTIDVVSGQDSEPEPTDERRGESLTITKFAAKVYFFFTFSVFFKCKACFMKFFEIHKYPVTSTHNIGNWTHKTLCIVQNGYM